MGGARIGLIKRLDKQYCSGGALDTLWLQLVFATIGWVHVGAQAVQCKRSGDAALSWLEPRDCDRLPLLCSRKTFGTSSTSS